MYSLCDNHAITNGHKKVEFYDSIYNEFINYTGVR